MDSRKHLNDLLQKYQRKQCTPEEEQQLQQWLAELEQLTQDQPIFTNEQEAAAVERSIWTAIEKETQRPLKRMAIVQLLRPWAAAAAVIGVMWLGWSWYQRSPYAGVPASQLVVAWDTVSASQHELKKIILPDGSKICLNSGSQLRYPKRFGQRTREVQLLFGEANFDVAHDSRHPFIVNSNGITTRVLGTQFTVTAYRALPEIRVSVSRGKVQVKAKHRLLGLLLKDQEIRYNVKDQSAQTYKGNVCVFDPEKQSYFLNNCSFDELAMRMENAFGLKLIAGNEVVTSYRFTGELDLKSSPNSILTKFSGIHAGRFKISGKEVYMY